MVYAISRQGKNQEVEKDFGLSCQLHIGTRREKLSVALRAEGFRQNRESR